MTDDTAATTDSEIVDEGPVKTLESLPTRPLTEPEFRALETADTFDTVGPLLTGVDRRRVYAFSFGRGDDHVIVGWHPVDEQWQQLIHINTAGEADGQWDIDVVEIIDDDSGEPVIVFEPHESTIVSDIHDYVWEYIEYVYEATDHLEYLPHSVDDSVLE